MESVDYGKLLEPLINIVQGLVSMGWPGLIAGGVILLLGLFGFGWLKHLQIQAALQRSKIEAEKAKAGNTTDNQTIENGQKEAESKIEDIRKNNPDDAKKPRP